MTRPLAILAAIVGALFLGLTYLALAGAAPDAARHERTLEALRTLTLSDAALQRDVLRARAGLLGSYDPLVSAVADLRGAAAALASAGAAANGETRAEIDRRAEDVAAAVREQEALVDSFKSRNALLQNSLAYFSLLSSELGPAADRPRARAMAGVSELANAMLRFAGGPDRKSAAEVDAALDRLDRSTAPPGLEHRADALLAHGRLIVATLPAVDDLVAGILTAPIARRARDVQDAYLDFYGRAAARADAFRVLLYGAALLLAAYLGVLFLRLRSNARALGSRLGFESLIAAISTTFIDLPRERIGEGIGSGLARLGGHTGVDRAAIVVGEEARVERFHSWRRDAGTPPGLPAEALLGLAAQWSLRGHDGRGWIHVPNVAALPGGEEGSGLRGAGVATWLCIPMWRAGRRVGFLAFDSLRPKQWLDDDLALLRTAAEIFANAIERERSEAEREALETRLAQSQRLEAVGTLAGGIAHEFNNILGVILGAAEMALTARGASGLVRRRLRQIMKAAERAQSVVDQVLAFSRRRERRRGTVLARPAVAEAVELIRASLPATVTVSARLAADGAAVRGDPTELQQVVMNLCTNAAHAMDGRGTIDLSLDTVAVPGGRALSHGSLAAGAYVRLAVRDTGHGMDEATLERIFEPFFTTKAAGTGTGLGLAMVHGIVADHGGAMNVRSRPGVGSSFEAYFPQSDAPPADEDGSEGPLPRGGGETVLLVDDEPPLVRLGEEMLAAIGYEPVGFDRSPAALAAVRADPNRFDLVLTDELMPEMTGTELASALHEIRPDLPIILMTGHGGRVDARAVRAAGVREVLKKPLLSADLAQGLARHLAPHRRGYNE